jgi:hypothetical protein
VRVHSDRLMIANKLQAFIGAPVWKTLNRSVSL